ncbi:MAG: glycosyltransferase family 2 protein [Paracoccus sp. (in: a-proteobacteria)]|nr:glycosyltransferase family 2 protein [Paracoccus sp. (in: a-proteobacteria)]
MHYLRYGNQLNRDPGPDFSVRFTRLAYDIRDHHEPVARLAWMRRRSATKLLPNPKRVLRAASLVAKAGEHDRAIALAESHLPAELAYTANILRANAAIARSDEVTWLKFVNAYLSQFDLAPIRLQGSGTLFERLTTGALPPVTGGPLVSVIMPAWNAENTVGQAARSILNQSWRNLELLIVDDCSTDGTWPVLQQIAAKDDRVKIRRNKVNVGPYVSKNIALTEAKGDYVTGHDADDWAHPQRIEKHLAASSERNIDASLTYMIRM